MPPSPPRRSLSVIGIAGGTASGKTSVCCQIIEKLESCGNGKRVALISQESFYRDLSEESRALAARGDYNFDHPDAFDHPSMVEAVKVVRDGRSVEVPHYDFVSQARSLEEVQEIDGAAEVLLVEGILVFFDPAVRGLFDLKVFVDCDADIRLARRVERDTKERGRPLKHVLHQYLKHVKPAFEDFCLPTKKYADLIIPRGAENDVAINLIVQHIQEILREASPPSSLSSNGSGRTSFHKPNGLIQNGIVATGKSTSQITQKEGGGQDVGAGGEQNKRKITRPH